MSGFTKFIMRGNVVDLAVAVVIGAAFGNVVTALVEGFITPLIGVFGGVPDFSALTFTVNGSTFQIGSIINAVLSFLLIAAVVYYFVVMPVNSLLERVKPAEPPPPPEPETIECPECLSRIPAAARRCAYCTAEIGTPRVPTSA